MGIDSIQITLGLVIPWLGVLLLLVGLLHARTDQLSCICATAFFLALVGNAVLGWLWLQTPFTAGGIFALISTLTVFSAVVGLRRLRNEFPRDADTAGSGGSHGLPIVLAGVLGVGYLTITGVANYNLGFVAWDAWDYWMLQARTWFFAGDMTELIDYMDWARSDDPEVYAFHHSAPHWPSLSLITVWHAAAIGSWKEQLLTLPWWLTYAALIFSVYCILRNLECQRGLAATGALMVASTPLIMHHAMMGGYAELLIGGLLLCAVYWVSQWSLEPTYRKLILVATLFAVLPLIKVTTVFWFAMAAALLLFGWGAVLVLRISKPVAALVAISGVGALSALLAFLTGTPADRIAENGWTIAGQMFSGWNWSLSPILLLAAASVAVFMPLRVDRDYFVFFSLGSMLVISCLFVYEFLVAPHEILTTSNRLFLQVMPSAIVGIILVARDLSSQGNSSDLPDQQSSERV